jgi:hypothetical protein
VSVKGTYHPYPFPDNASTIVEIDRVVLVMSQDWIDGDLPQFVARPSNAGPLIIDLDRTSP